MKKNQIAESRSGSAILTAMGLIFVFAVMAGGFYTYAVGTLKQTSRLGDVVRARAIAEAGANDAVSYLMMPGYYGERTNADNFVETAYAGGTFDVTVLNSTDTNSPGRCLVISTGAYNGVKAAMIVDLRDTRRESLTDGSSRSWSDFAIFANGKLGFNGSPRIIGDTHTNNDFDLNGNPTNITGTISAKNQIDLITQIGTNRLADWQLIPFPGLSDPEFQTLVNQARSSGLLTEIYGNKTYKNGEDFNVSTNAITIVHGSVTFLGSGTHDVDGIFYVTGSITANGKAIMNLRGSLLAGGDILFNGAAGVFSYSASGAGGGGSAGSAGDADSNAEAKVYAMWQVSAQN